MVKSIFIIGVFTALASQRSFVDTAPASDAERANSEVKGDDNVKELENLKSSLGRTLSLMRTQTSLYSDINGEKEAHSTNTEEVKQNGELVAKISQRIDSDPQEQPDRGGHPQSVVQTEMEFPSEGIRKSTKEKMPVDYPELTENGNRKSLNTDLTQDAQNTADESNRVSGGLQQHTPLDMAEYIYWTGDEKSVSRAIEEYLQEGLTTKEEAIVFLQEIKYNLDYLKSHYSRYGLNSREEPSMGNKGKQELQENYQISRNPKVGREKTVDEQIRSELNQLRQLQETYKKRSAEREAAAIYFTGSNQEKSSDVLKDGTAEDYQDLLEKLRLADFLYTEYSLEEVIYQLAKVMFTQSLTGGSAEAQSALTRFMNFLQKEAEQGHISRALEKKVLDVLIASLSDTVSEHPELLGLREGTIQTNENVGGRQFLKQILELPPEDKAFLQKILNPSFNDRRDQDKTNLLTFHLRNKKVGEHVPFGLEK